MPRKPIRSFVYDYQITSQGVSLNVDFSDGLSDTSQIPDIYSKIMAYLPSVLLNKCFNEKRIPFRYEVAKTELGHLLEHIILENMCIQKHKSIKNDYVSISGRTFWSTDVSPVQKFNIKIYCSLADIPLFFKVINPSFELMSFLCGDTLTDNNCALYQITPKQPNAGERSGKPAPSRDNLSLKPN